MPMKKLGEVGRNDMPSKAKNPQVLFTWGFFVYVRIDSYLLLASKIYF